VHRELDHRAWSRRHRREHLDEPLAGLVDVEGRADLLLDQRREDRPGRAPRPEQNDLRVGGLGDHRAAQGDPLPDAGEDGRTREIREHVHHHDADDLGALAITHA
jgi:hypothetical protein